MSIQNPIPADVPKEKIKIFQSNFNRATGGSGRLMLFAGDQKVEHMNSDFAGKNIPADDAHPLHLFQIAAKAKVGVFAVQLGLIIRYGKQFPDLPYLVKLNSKTNLVSVEQNDPVGKAWYTVEQVVNFSKQSKINIIGVGYTVYLGSEHEAEMLTEAAQIVHQAHLNGMLTVLWIYPKGKAISNEHDADLIAGAAGVANCLGADFVKLKIPFVKEKYHPDLLKKIVVAAGNTGVLCEGGAKEYPGKFLNDLHHQIHVQKTRGNGTGRNIHQNKLSDAVKMANAIYAITVENKSVKEALKMIK